MPRKKQTVQTQKRRKAYMGPMHADATKIKPRGFFRIFSNYRVFAVIGAVAIIGGLAISALYQSNRGNNSNGTNTIQRGTVDRSTPEADSTSVTGASSNRKQYPAPPALSIDTAKTYTATIKTDKGEITVELDAAAAPQTVNNFVFLARDGYYDGVTFHRVIEDFVAQTGDPTGTGSGGPGYDLPVETTSQPFTSGVLAMAKPQEAGSPNNGSQFFILLNDEPTFEGKFTAFGKVTNGLDIAKELAPRDPDSVESPDPGDRIESITIQES